MGVFFACMSVIAWYLQRPKEMADTDLELRDARESPCRFGKENPGPWGEHLTTDLSSQPSCCCNS